MRVLGVVLAGGESSRFGSDKARALLDGRPLIAHAVEALRPHVEAVAIGGTAGPRRHPDDGGSPYGQPLLSLHEVARMDPGLRRNDEGGWAALPIIADLPEGGLGPLGGIAGALAHAAEGGFTHVLSLPCDTPVLPEGLLATLAADPGPAALEGLPVCGIWPVTLGPALIQRLEAHDNRSMRGWIEAIGGRWVAHPPIANVNRPADLIELARNGGGG